MLCPFFLERHSQIVEAHFARHGLGEHLLQSRGRLSRTVAWRGCSIDLSAAIKVVAQRKLRAGNRFRGGEGRQRHGFPIVVAHIKQAQILSARSILPFSLDIDLPLPAEPVEIVYEIAAHESLKRLVHLGQFHPFLEGFVAVHIHVELGNRRQKSGGDAGDLWTLARRLHEFGDIGGQEGNVFAGPVLENEGEAAGGADALNGRRREGERDRARNLGNLPAEVRLDGVITFFALFALSPFLQAHPERGAVGIAGKTEQVESRYGCAILYPRCGQHDVFHLLANCHRPLQGSGERELNADVKKTLVFLRQET